jgi:tRNA (guanine-N7-)-methyltransferase
VPRSRRLPAEQLAPLLLDVPHPRTSPERWRHQLALMPPTLLDWPTLYGNAHPVEIEVGFGKGLFLLNVSGRRPATNFLGIEIERKYVLLTADRLVRRGVNNVRLACTDAHWLLRECVPAESLAAVHVYFPDPWWKKRHHKRRLLTAEFAVECARVVRPGGSLHFASDVAEYFAETKAMLDDSDAWKAIAWPTPAEPCDDEDYLTNFERKYRKEGRAIYRALYERLV